MPSMHAATLYAYCISQGRCWLFYWLNRLDKNVGIPVRGKVAFVWTDVTLKIHGFYLVIFIVIMPSWNAAIHIIHYSLSTQSVVSLQPFLTFFFFFKWFLTSLKCEAANHLIALFAREGQQQNKYLLLLFLFQNFIRINIFFFFNLNL